MSYEHVRRALGLCLIALTVAGLLTQTARPEARHGGDETDDSGGPEMVRILPGRFQMGSASSEAGRYADEGPVHAVTLHYAFEVSKYPVTRGDWRRYLKDTGKSGASAGCYGYSFSMTPVDAQPSTHAAAAAKLLRTLQADREHMRELLKTLGPRHPDMIRLQGQIDALGHSLDEENLQRADKTLRRPGGPVMVALQARLVAKEQALAELLVTDGPQHPDVIYMQAQIDAARSTIKAEQARLQQLSTFEGSLPRSPDELALDQRRVALYAAQADRAVVLKIQGPASAEARRLQRKIDAAQSSIQTQEAQIRRQHLQYNWSTPGFPQQDDQPVVCVSWEDAQDYVAWLSRKTGSPYRLLSESEYEYVARAGARSAYTWGPAADKAQCSRVNAADDSLSESKGPLGQVHASCSDGFTFTSPVDHFPPNAFGLHDTVGNVWAWVQDCYQVDYQGAPAEGRARTGPKDCSLHVVRGGAWDSPPYRLRPTAREGASGAYMDVGFRVAKTLTP